jgi:hypothetical protein
MTRVVVAAAAVVGALALLGRWWRDARTDARLAQVDEPDAFVPMAAWHPSCQCHSSQATAYIYGLN